MDMLPVIDLIPVYEPPGEWEAGEQELQSEHFQKLFQHNQGSSGTFIENWFQGLPRSDTEVLFTLRINNLDLVGGTPAVTQMHILSRTTADSDAGPIADSESNIPIIPAGDGLDCDGQSIGTYNMPLERWNQFWIDDKYLSGSIRFGRDRLGASNCGGADILFDISIDYSTTHTPFVFNIAPGATVLKWRTKEPIVTTDGTAKLYHYADMVWDAITAAWVVRLKSERTNKYFYAGPSADINGRTVAQARIEYRPSIIRFFGQGTCIPV